MTNNVENDIINMKLTRKRFAKIEHLMPMQRKKSTISNYDFVCALLYII